MACRTRSSTRSRSRTPRQTWARWRCHRRCSWSLRTLWPRLTPRAACLGPRARREPWAGAPRADRAPGTLARTWAGGPRARPAPKARGAVPGRGPRRRWRRGASAALARARRRRRSRSSWATRARPRRTWCAWCTARWSRRGPPTTSTCAQARPPRGGPASELCTLPRSSAAKQADRFIASCHASSFGGRGPRSARQPTARGRPADAKALRKQQAAGGYDRALFRSTRLWAPSTGGVEARAAPLLRLRC